MTTDNQNPVFETVPNFRDFGGYRTKNGRRLRKGLLYRSGQFPNASSADLQLLEALKIQTVVDLRTPTERQNYPSPRWPNFAGNVVEQPEEEAMEAETAPHLAAFIDACCSAEAAHTAMLRAYRGMPFEPTIMALYRRYFAALAEADAPVLVHCAAGKDRTGIIVALTHHLMGVDPADMKENYLSSNNGSLDLPGRVTQLRTSMTLEGRTVSDEAIRTVLSVAPDYLDAAFEAIAARFGSLDAYLQDVLGVAPERRAAIADRLTVED